MKNKLTNTHTEIISLFVKIDGVEQQVQIPAGESIIIDAYETKTIKIFKKREFITIESFSSILVDEILSAIQEDMKFDYNLPTDNLEVKSNDINPTILEIIQGEVEQYIEGGYVKGEWTEEDLVFLKKNYPIKGRKFCSIHLNRNESSVQKKINSLGLKKKRRKK